MQFERDIAKNMLLQTERWVCFEDVVAICKAGSELLIEESGTYPDQHIIVVLMHEYIYAVPCIIAWWVVRLITIYPTRKRKKAWLT